MCATTAIPIVVFSLATMLLCGDHVLPDATNVNSFFLQGGGFFLQGDGFFFAGNVKKIAGNVKKIAGA
jgi:hypothetical protein